MIDIPAAHVAQLALCQQRQAANVYIQLAARGAGQIEDIMTWTDLGYWTILNCVRELRQRNLIQYPAGPTGRRCANAPIGIVIL